ncbi:DUF4911 domain-containing protein [Fundidesulfovibrio agrisoli]|uniref:DUF4911 domain-containing protein n=1 Tax=Fundidesulfovibrio agrisoli TaxID=2922717 RepID=UPI001FAE2F39
MPEPRPRKRRQPYIAPRRSARLYLKLEPKNLGMLRFLLEAQSHLGLATTLDRHAGIAKVIYSPDCEREMAAFLEQAAELIPLQRIAI